MGEDYNPVIFLNYFLIFHFNQSPYARIPHFCPFFHFYFNFLIFNLISDYTCQKLILILHRS